MLQNTDKTQINSSFPRSNRFVTCPMCEGLINEVSINEHLDSIACQSHKNAQKRVKIEKNPLPLKVDTLDEQLCAKSLIGLYVFDDFITQEFESDILNYLQHSEVFTETYFNGKHDGTAWGVKCDLKNRCTYPQQREFPEVISKFIEFMREKLNHIDQNEISQWNPNEANAIRYIKSKGHSLGAHIDDRYLSKGPIINLSLLGECTMTYRKIETPKPSGKATKTARNSQNSSSLKALRDLPDTIRVQLRPRSLQIMSGTLRYHYTHAIDHQDLIDPTRFSITFRYSPITQKNQV